MLDPQRRWRARRREARLRRPCELLRGAVHRGPRRAARRGRGDRRRPARRAGLRTAGHPPRPAGDPRRQRDPGARTCRRASTRSSGCAWSTTATRRCCRPPPSARTRRSRRRSAEVARAGADAARARRRPLDRRARHPRLRGRSRAGRADPLRRPHRHRPPSASAWRSRTGPRCTTLVRDGRVDPERYVQIGLRGYWPGQEVFAWQREHGHHARSSCTTSTARGIARGGRARRSRRSATARSFLTVDVDVLDPAFAPGTGHPGARRHDLGRAAVGLPRARRRARRRRRRRGRGVPDRDRRRRHHRAGRFADRPRDAHRHRPAPRGGRPAPRGTRRPGIRYKCRGAPPTHQGSARCRPTSCSPP